ncbi:MAG: hypothetical protein ABSH21_04440 [Verrucomicrobiia bacterium]
MYLTQKTQALLLTAAGCVLAIVITLGILKLVDPTSAHNLVIGKTPVDTALIAFVLTRLLLIAAYILFVILGFRTHWGWGLANLLLPVTALYFSLAHPRTAKIPAVFCIFGFTALLVTMLWVNPR